MDGLLSGLESLGLGGLEDVKIFDKAESEKKEKESTPVKIKEKDFIFDRAYECPVCGNKFTAKTVKTGRARLLRTDLDLRPSYEGIDAVKYDTVVCTLCGNAALSRYFKSMTSPQAKLIKDNISQKIVLREYTGETYTYEEALERYKLALACAVVKRAQPSEKAYICLKSAWLLRGYAENPDEMLSGNQKLEELKNKENAYLINAYEGFADARQKESPPICGMDEVTVDYLLSVLAFWLKKYDVASRLISSILTSTTANPRMKDKTRDLKDMVLAEIKKDKK